MWRDQVIFFYHICTYLRRFITSFYLSTSFSYRFFLRYFTFFGCFFSMSSMTPKVVTSQNAKYKKGEYHAADVSSDMGILKSLNTMGGRYTNTASFLEVFIIIDEFVISFLILCHIIRGLIIWILKYERKDFRRSFLIHTIRWTLSGAAKRNLNSLALQFSRRKQPDGSHHKLLDDDDAEVSWNEVAYVCSHKKILRRIKRKWNRKGR